MKFAQRSEDSPEKYLPLWCKSWTIKHLLQIKVKSGVFDICTGKMVILKFSWKYFPYMLSSER